MNVIPSSLKQLLALFLFLFAQTLFPSGAAAQAPYAKALKAKRAAQGKLFKIPGVVASGISLSSTGQAEIKVFVENDRVRGVPQVVDGIRVRQVVSGKFTAYQNRKQAKGGNKGKPGDGGGDDGGGGETVNDNPRTRFERAVPIGVSIGATSPNYCFAGTLGCRLRLFNLNTGTSTYFILSNNHVMADENRAVPDVDLILQPGSLDNNCQLRAEDIIGTLHDYEPIQFNGAPNTIDAAIAITTTAQTGFATPSTIYGAPSSTSQAAAVGLSVKKFGRTTGLTEGVVDAINVDVNVGYDRGSAFFTDQIIIEGRRRRGRKYVTASFSDGGDSGSLIVSSEGNNPVGLLFAGNSSYTIANPIDAVLDRFSDAAAGNIMVVDDGSP